MVGLIAVAIDGSPAGRSALVLAASQANLAGMSVAVLCTIDAAYAFRRDGAISMEDETEYPAAASEELSAQKVIGDARDYLRAEGVDAIDEALIGLPARQIVDAADRLGAKMIVMGHRHLTWFDRMLHPSICWDVLEHAKCPVLVSMTDVCQTLRTVDQSSADA
jgi:nucleotide-binding universal stress UspA family protein